MRLLSARDADLVEAARTRCLLLGRDDWVAVVARGRDQRKFLHAMLTQDVKGLDTGSVRPTCLCDAQGAMIAVAWQVLLGDQTLLWTERSTAEALREGLDRFVIMDDVELVIDEDLALVQLLGPQVDATATAAGWPHPGDKAVAHEDGGGWQWSRPWGGAEGSPFSEPLPSRWFSIPRTRLGDVVDRLVAAGAEIGSHAATDTLRIACGWPQLGGRDIDDGSLPLEAGLKPTIDYRKGCYLGQEAIAMMTYRGQIRRHLCWVERSGELGAGCGWTLRTSEGKRAGRMGTSVQWPDGRWLGLAMVQRKAYARGGLLTASDDSGNSATIRILGTTVAGVLDSQEGA